MSEHNWFSPCKHQLHDYAKAFYEMLGFKEYWLVPETNTPEVANAVGMDSYRVKGSLMSLNDAENRTVIDLSNG